MLNAASVGNRRVVVGRKKVGGQVFENTQRTTHIQYHSYSILTTGKKNMYLIYMYIDLRSSGYDDDDDGDDDDDFRLTILVDVLWYAQCLYNLCIL